MALNAIGDEFRQSISRFFSVDAASPLRKQRRADHGADSDEERQPQPPINKKQAAWMQEAVAALLNAFAGVVNVELKKIEEKTNESHTIASLARQDVNALGSRYEEVFGELTHLRGQCTGLGSNKIAQDKNIEGMEKRIHELEAKLEALAVQPKAAASSHNHLHEAEGPMPPPGHAASSQSVPRELRTLARIGALGWKLPRDELEKRAREAMQRAEVDGSTWSALSAVVSRRGEGSSCKLLFATPQDLQRARLQMRSKNIVMHEQRVVWIDARKDRAELRPGRIIHRCQDVVSDIELQKGTGAEVTKCLMRRIGFVAGNKAFYTVRGELKITEWGKQRYNDDEQLMVKGFAEDC